MLVHTQITLSDGFRHGVVHQGSDQMLIIEETINFPTHILASTCFQHVKLKNKHGKVSRKNEYCDYCNSLKVPIIA